MKRLASACLERLGRYLRASMLVLAACSSSGSTVDEIREFHDERGRLCQAKLSRTSANARVVNESVSCDGGAKQCSSESHPCFELSTAEKEGGYTLRNCPACCSGTASSFYSAECSAVACESDDDCIFAQAQCQDAVCVCPNGVCD